MNLSKDKYKDATSEMLSHINVGTGKDCSIKELAEIISDVTNFKGKIIFDASKPDGAPRKLMDVSRLNKLGWNHSITLKDGLEQTYDWYLNNIKNARYK
jgi:GDP-L-fucose synthase